jgi:hypothetical protein
MTKKTTTEERETLRKQTTALHPELRKYLIGALDDLKTAELALLGRVWSATDPREWVGKRAKIVVHAPEGEVFMAEVETKHSYCVFLRGRGPDKKSHIAEDNEWPPEYLWTLAPLQ